MIINTQLRNGITHALWFLTLVLWLALVSCWGAVASQKIDVRGDEASYSADGKRAEFSGNVVLTFNGKVIRSQQLLVEVRKGGNRYTASGAVQATCADCNNQQLRFTANTLIVQDGDAQILRVFGDIELCAGESPQCALGKVSATSIHWQKTNDTAKLLGEPILGYWMLPSGERTDFQAEKIAYDNKSGGITMQGTARLERGDSEIAGDTISFNFRTGALSAEGGDAGRVRGVFGGE